MPYALKGIDAVLFAVFSSLGVNVRVRPVLDNEAWEREDEYYQTEYKEHWNYVEGEGFESWKARQVAITRYGSGFEGIGSSDHDGLELSKVRPCPSIRTEPARIQREELTIRVGYQK